MRNHVSVDGVSQTISIEGFVFPYNGKTLTPGLIQLSWWKRRGGELHLSGEEPIQITRVQEDYDLYVKPHVKSVFTSLSLAAQSAWLRADIKYFLQLVDKDSTRSLRAIVYGVGTKDDQTKLDALQARANGLRAELNDVSLILNNPQRLEAFF
jgi:hypothetical protein